MSNIQPGIKIFDFYGDLKDIAQ